MKRTELTDKDINYIIELYHQKKSMREIGAIIHIAPERVKKILLENKIVINKKGIISTFDLHKQEIIQKYHIDTTPRKITVSKIINGKKFILDR